MNDLEWPVLSYYVIYYEKFKNVMQETENLAKLHGGCNIISEWASEWVQLTWSWIILYNKICIKIWVIIYTYYWYNGYHLCDTFKIKITQVYHSKMSL